MTGRRLNRSTRATIRIAVGACPACSIYEPGFSGSTEIYRRSNRSITMRCQVCGLQWTMTLAKIHQAMKRHLTLIGEVADTADRAAVTVYEGVATLTEPAAARERRGRVGG